MDGRNVCIGRVKKMGEFEDEKGRVIII